MTPGDLPSGTPDKDSDEAPESNSGSASVAKSASGTATNPRNTAGVRRRTVRRVSRPRTSGVFDSPVRNLAGGVIFTLIVMMLATAAYMSAGWSFKDAIYMVTITVFTVGYDEVRPIDTVTLRMITIALIVCGCIGIIFLTSALVQFFTFSQFNRTMGLRRMNTQIDRLEGHVILCGFGRLGGVLARSLAASSAGFVVLEENEARVLEARSSGYLCIHGDATSEAMLHAAGIKRAQALAAVLSNDALNVFITLSARALNATLLIVARGEVPSTERKLLQAGADKVVLPTHIGAERIAELLLHEESARFIESLEKSHGFQRILHNLGMELEVVTVAPNSPASSMTLAAVERQSKGAFFIVQINRRDGDVFTAPPVTTVIAAGDSVVLIGRPNRSAVVTSLFEPRTQSGVRG
jgi:voltage-gated potassium channel